MKIGIDIRVLTKGAHTGVEEYVALVLKELIKLGKDDEFVLYYNALSKERADFEWMRAKNVSLKESHWPNQFLNYLFLLGWPKVDKLLGGADVLFSPHFLNVATTKKCKKVITFHDLSFLRHPEFFPWRKRYWHFIQNIKKQAREADKIIAISESTKNDLIDLCGIKEEKIKVIYSGINPQFKPIADENYLKLVKEKYRLPDNFILYFGTVEPRKNIGSIIEAFELIKENKFSPHSDLKLVIAGGFGWLYKNILKRVKSSPYAGDIIFTGAVEASDRAGVYNLAKLFVFPSFFEGFGFPPLEAMACGVPTITSNSSSLPETVGDGAIMIDPYRPEEIAIAAREIFNDEELKNLLIQKGFERVKKFSWENCAKETLKWIKE